MSKSPHTESSLRDVAKAWREASFEQRARIVTRIVIGACGLVCIVTAVIAIGGWWGALLIFGHVLGKGSEQ